MFSSVVPSSKRTELSVNSFTFGFNTMVPERRQDGSSSLIIILKLELAGGKEEDSNVSTWEGPEVSSVVRVPLQVFAIPQISLEIKNQGFHAIKTP